MLVSDFNSTSTPTSLLCSALLSSDSLLKHELSILITIEGKAFGDRRLSSDRFPFLTEIQIQRYPQARIVYQLRGGPAFQRRGNAKDPWAKTVIPATQKKLDTVLPGSRLSLSGVISLMDSCSVKTISPPGGKSISSFCHVFIELKWHAHIYYEILDKPLCPCKQVQRLGEIIIWDS